ncbi:MAG: STAS domain-containing protein [Halomonas sp.]
MTLLLEHHGARLEVTAEGLRVSGRVGFEVATALAAAGREWLATQPDGTRVVFDLCGVAGVSSAALSVVLEWMRSARDSGLTLGKVRLSHALQRLTEVAGLDRLLPL